MYNNASIRASDVRGAVSLAVILFVGYNLNFRAIPVGDTIYKQYAALSLAAGDGIDITEFHTSGAIGLAVGGAAPNADTGPCYTPCLIERGLTNGSLQLRDGRVYSNYPIVPSLAAAPAYYLALRAGFLNPRETDLFKLNAVGKLVGSAFTATACGVLLLLLKRWTPEAPAGLIACAAGVATPLWSTASQSLWSHAPAVLALGLALLGISITRGVPGAVASGVAFGVAVACRPLLVFFAAGAVVGLALQRHELRRAVGIAAGVALVLVPLAICHTIVFGTPLGGLAVLESAAVHRAMHGVEEAFSGSLWQGLAGVLVSPSRGLFVYSPVVLLSLAGAVLLWRRHRFARWLLVLPAGAFLLAWSKFAVWWGGHSFGPRFAADLVVPFALLAAALFASELARTRARWAEATIVALLSWSIWVQVIGAFFHPNGDWNSTPVNVDAAHTRIWDWRDTQIARALRAGPYVQHLEPLKAAVSERLTPGMRF